ncbi:MAG: hypothetical protein U1E60_19030 [Reyranellaceae bacterium]
MSAPTIPASIAPERYPTIDDSVVLGTATACMRARAEAMLVWAQGDEVNKFGAHDVMRPDNADKQVEEFRRALARLANHHPRTVRGAIVMLNVALDLLVHRMLNPELVLGEGPVIELVRNVRSALENVDWDLPLEIGRATPEVTT